MRLVLPNPPPGPSVIPGAVFADGAAGAGPLAGRFGGLGDPGTVLLSGPAAECGHEPIKDHVGRWGVLPDLDSGEILDLLWASGLDGRGGAGFLLARKVATALDAGGVPLLIVNASESEPASGKDRALCAFRPHLVLDGATLLATALGATNVVVHLHRSATAAVQGIAEAMCERSRRGSSRRGSDRPGSDHIEWSLSLGPDRYVSGESSAVAGFVHEGDARPRFTMVPLAVSGPTGRPTVVSNAETVAQVAALARLGPTQWVGLGTPSSPGSRLLTLVGSVERPGRVVELVGGATVGELLSSAGVAAPPAAVLVGGYAGTWVAGDEAWHAPFDRAMMTLLGASPGCGLLGVLPHGACGLRESARIVRYLAGESAGQCGTCVAGLPRLASSMESLAAGTFRRRGLKRMDALGDEVMGSGACGHPDGVVRLIRSTLDVFGDDVVRHLAGEPCSGSDHPPVFAVPEALPDGRLRSDSDFA